MNCTYCGEPGNLTEAGFKITPIVMEAGKKTGRLIVYEDVFPDGVENKFLCYECIYEIGLAEILGIGFPTN